MDLRQLNDLRRLNLSHLISFVAVVRCGSFRAAAAKLNISQSAISVQLRQLEDLLGAKLLLRTTRSVELTPEGTRLLAVAERISEDLCSITHRFRDEAALHRGTVTVVAPTNIAACLVPQVIRKAAEVYPGIEVNLLVRATSMSAYESIVKEEADIAIAYRGAIPENQPVAELYRDELVAIVPAEMPLPAGQGEIGLRALAEYPFIAQSKGTYMRAAIERHCLEQGVELDIRYEMVTPMAIVGMVSAGLGAAIVPLSGLAFLNLSRCRIHRMRGIEAQTVGQFTSARRYGTPAVTALEQLITSLAAQYRVTVREMMPELEGMA